ncbi:MAG: energy transducer TonB [Candidatus Electryonea clarkiae]|nr:energy transducer TonB [Candidatus Electryonea clarkiae]MDP8288764.1 energy transducer TonB [Candidatus Electryonea clarkiae]
MLSYKKPEAEVRMLYPKMVEIGFLGALFLITMVFLFSKRMETKVFVRGAEEVVLETEEIPITQQIKRPPPPARPSIPIEDPDVDMEDDLTFDDLDEIDWSMEAPPPPPSAEDVIVDFFAVEDPPMMSGGSQALYDYLAKNNLYPEMALKAEITGDVIIIFVVNEKGLPQDVEISQERPAGLGFGPAGVKAIKAMKFSPGYQRDKPVKVKMQQVIRFRLE